MNYINISIIEITLFYRDQLSFNGHITVDNVIVPTYDIISTNHMPFFCKLGVVGQACLGQGFLIKNGADLLPANYSHLARSHKLVTSN